MGKFSLILLFLCLVQTSQGKYKVNLLNESCEKTEFEIYFDEPSFDPIGDGFHRVTMDEFGYRGEEFGPELIGRVFNVAVPKGSDVDVLVDNVEWSKWLDILPAPACSLTGHHNIIGELNKSLYAQVHGGTANIVWDAIMRGVRIIGIDILPVQYSPDSGVRYMKNAKIVVNHPGGNGKIYDERLYHYEFAEIFRSMIINYESAIPPEPKRAFDWDTLDGAELLIITRPDFVDTVKKWENWKIFTGMPTKIVKTNVAGHDTASIKSYIRNAYDNWDLPPAYILLVSDGGSGDLIPAFNYYPEGCYGDHNYTLVDGEDIIQDIFIGRISADNISQLRVMLQKHFNYERSPDTTDNWYARAVGIVREENCTTPLGPDDSSYLAAVRYAMTQCALSGFTSTPIFRKCSGHTSDTVRPYIDAGCNFVTYRGQGVADWFSPFNGLLTEPTRAKAPITISITCATGNFISSDDYPCEYSTRCGTVSSPCGSVAWIGQTRISSNTQERSRLSYGIFKGWFEGRVRTLGAAHAYGKAEMLNFFGPSYAATSEYLTTSLIGACDMVAWTAPIVNADVFFPPVVGTGEMGIPVTVYANGSPVENARVAIHQGNSLSYGFTDNLGSVTITKTVLPYPSSLVLVVTGQNIYPYIDTIAVSTSEVIIYNSPVRYMEVVGNGDTLINPGETFSFAPSIVNYGTATAEGLMGILRTSDTLITIIDSTCEFPPASTTEPVTGDTVSFYVSVNHPASDALDLRLYVYGHPLGPWENSVSPIAAVHRFEASLGDIVILDPPPYGNGDGTVNPGEQIDLSITIENNTYANVYSLSGILECERDKIAVIQPYGDYGDISAHSFTAPLWNYIISVSPEMPSPSLVLFNLVLSGSCGNYEFYDTLPIHVTISGPSLYPSPWLHFSDSLSYNDIDGNGLIEPGDEIEMRFNLRNGGSVAATNVSATAVSTYLITSSGEQAMFGDIPSGTSVYNSDSPIRFSISHYCPNGITLRVPISLVANGGGYMDTISVNIEVSGEKVSEKQNIKDYVYVKVFPNPFNNSASIDIDLAVPVISGKLYLCNISGKLVKRIFDGEIRSGKYKFDLAGNENSSGIYFLILETQNGIRQCLKTLLIK